MYMKNNKKVKNDNKKLIAGIIIVALVLILGTSYAFFVFTLKAEKELSVVTGTFKIDYKDQNRIELENAYPMKDEKGMSLTPYEFSVENTGDLKALYDISLETTESSNLDYRWLKYSLKKNDGEWSSPKKLTNLKLEEGFELDPTAKDTYQLKLWIDEGVGNEAQGKVFIAKVIVSSVQSNKNTFDVTPPTITLNGDFSENVEQGAIYDDPGVDNVYDDKTAMDTNDVKIRYEYFDGKITETVESIDTNRVGVYYIYYTVKDASGNEGRVVRSVNVYKKDSTPPIITLNGERKVTVEKGSSYEELGARASKNEEDLTNRIVTVGTVNEKKPGTYTIKYLITDQEGNTASVTRTVYVVYISDGVADDINIDLSENPSEKINLTGENLGELIYQSSDESIASVDSEGTVTGLAPGEATIHITTSTGLEKEIHVKVVKTVTVTYQKQGTGISIGKTSDSCEITSNGGSCEVTTPSISPNSGYTAVGWNTNKEATTGTASSTKIAVMEDVTYYSIFYKNAVTYSVNFNANRNTISSTKVSCVLPAAYNGASQATSCNITTPVITAPAATPTVVGYNQTQSATTSQVGSKASLTVTASINGKTYYAITRKDAVTRSITYSKGTGVSSIGKSSDSCTIAATYNGTSQGTSCNVTLPSITAGTGYTSPAWYPSNAVSGTASSVNTAHALSSNKTLYAVAKRNFTCASVGSTTRYAESNWTTILKDNDYCYLALNGISSSTGTYAERTSKLTAEYFNTSTTARTALLNEKNAGLISEITSYGPNTGVSTTDVWWSQFGEVYSHRTFPYYTEKLTDVNFGGSFKSNGTIMIEGFDGQNGAKVTGYNTGTKSSCDSLSGANCIISNGSVSGSVSGHGSTSWTRFATSKTEGSTTKFAINYKLTPGSTGSASQYVLYIKACGGSYHNANRYRITAKSTTQVNSYNYSTGNTTAVTKTNHPLWYVAGVASFTTETVTQGTKRVYNPGAHSSCIPTYTYTFGNGSYPIHYRLYIKVKM